jgi:hypothetical protein
VRGKEPGADRTLADPELCSDLSQAEALRLQLQNPFSVHRTLRSQPGRQGSTARSRQSATSVFTTEQTPIFAASSILLEVLTCNLNRRKKWPEHIESRGL